MKKDNIIEIVFHGRGGQGSVTAANLLVSAALKDGNIGVQAFPVFGAERLENTLLNTSGPRLDPPIPSRTTF